MSFPVDHEFKWEFGGAIHSERFTRRLKFRIREYVKRWKKSERLAHWGIKTASRNTVLRCSVCSIAWKTTVIKSEFTESKQTGQKGITTQICCFCGHILRYLPYETTPQELCRLVVDMQWLKEIIIIGNEPMSNGENAYSVGKT